MMSAAASMSARRDLSLRPKIDETQVDLLPKANDKVHCTFVLGMNMLDGSWQQRLISCTDDTIYIYRVADSFQNDMIPLHEVVSVSVMCNNTSRRHSADSFSHGHDTLKRTSKVPPRTATVVMRIPLSGPSEHDESDGIDLQQDQYDTFLQIKTIPDGFNSGRTYYLQAKNATDRERIGDQLSLLVAKAKVKIVVAFLIISVIFKILGTVMWVIKDTWWQNFFVNAVGAQLVNQIYDNDGSLSQLGKILENIDTFFTIAFTVELLINLYSHWMKPFFKDGWNLFDLLVVVVALIALGPVNVPINVLRCMRAFRVIRIFRRMQALRDIVNALTTAFIPVLNAFVIMFLVIAVYSILATTFFSDRAPEEFGTLCLSLITMFRLTAGLGWANTLPLIRPDGSVDNGAVCFMVSYIILVNWTLLQVTVAVLLDSFITARAVMEEEKEEEREKEIADRSSLRNTLDPLLERLARDYTDDTDLTLRLQRLFEVLDTDDSRGLSSYELQVGIKKLDFKPRIHLTAEDFLVMTKNGQLCDDKGQLSFAQFEAVMRNQLRLFAQRKLSNALALQTGSRCDVVLLGSLKALYHEMAGAREDQMATHSTLDQVKGHLLQVDDRLRQLLMALHPQDPTEAPGLPRLPSLRDALLPPAGHMPSGGPAGPLDGAEGLELVPAASRWHDSAGGGSIVNKPREGGRGGWGIPARLAATDKVEVSGELLAPSPLSLRGLSAEPESPPPSTSSAAATAAAATAVATTPEVTAAAGRRDGSPSLSASPRLSRGRAGSDVRAAAPLAHAEMLPHAHGDPHGPPLPGTSLTRRRSAEDALYPRRRAGGDHLTAAADPDWTNMRMTTGGLGEAPLGECAAGRRAAMDECAASRRAAVDECAAGRRAAAEGGLIVCGPLVRELVPVPQWRADEEGAAAARPKRLGRRGSLTFLYYRR